MGRRQALSAIAVRPSRRQACRKCEHSGSTRKRRRGRRNGGLVTDVGGPTGTTFEIPPAARTIGFQLLRVSRVTLRGRMRRILCSVTSIFSARRMTAVISLSVLAMGRHCPTAPMETYDNEFCPKQSGQNPQEVSGCGCLYEVAWTLAIHKRAASKPEIGSTVCLTVLPAVEVKRAS